MRLVSVAENQFQATRRNASVAHVTAATFYQDIFELVDSVDDLLGLGNVLQDQVVQVVLALDGTNEPRYRRVHVHREQLSLRQERMEVGDARLIQIAFFVELDLLQDVSVIVLQRHVRQRVGGIEVQRQINFQVVRNKLG